MKIAVAGLALAIAAVWVFVYGTHGKGFDWGVFTASLEGLSGRWLAASLFFSYGTYVVRALRWAVLIRPLRPRARFWNLLSATIMGFSAVTALGRAAEMPPSR